MGGKGKSQARQNTNGWDDGGQGTSRPKAGDEQISKTLAVTLRYYRNYNGLNADENGFILVRDIVGVQGKGGETFSEDDVQRVAETSVSKNNGKRFELKYLASQGYAVKAAYDHADRYPTKGTGKSKGRGKGKSKDNQSHKGGHQRWNGHQGQESHRQAEEDTSNPWRTPQHWSEQSWDTRATPQPEVRSRAEHYGEKGGASRQPTASPAASQQWSSAGTSGATGEQQPWVSYCEATSSGSTGAQAEGDRRTLPHTAGVSQSPSYEIEDEYEALEQHGLHAPSQTSSSPAATTLEASNWQHVLGDGRDLKRSEQQVGVRGQDQAVETAPHSRDEWSEFLDPASQRKWFSNDTTQEYFFEDEAAQHGWEKFGDAYGKTWWWHEATKRHFYPKMSGQ